MRLGFVKICQAASVIASLLLHSAVLICGANDAPPAAAEQSAAIASSKLNVYVIGDANASGPACIDANRCREKNTVAVLAEPIASPNSAALPASVPKPPSPQSFIGLRENYYYQRTELTQPPVALTNPNIRLPADDDVRIIGSAVLRLFLSETGQIDDITIDRSSLPESYVDAIVSAHKGIKFEPGQLNGKPVTAQIQIEINLSTDLAELTAGHRSE